MGFTGMSGKTGIVPDIVTYGKIIGGGLPVGALAAKKEVMEHLAPLGGVYQAGTLSANPLAMVGGLATMKLLTEELYEKLERNTEKIANIFKAFFAKNEQYQHLNIVTAGSLFWITPQEGITRACDIPENLMECFQVLFADMLERGIYLAPNPYEVGFVSDAHDDEVIKLIAKKLGV